MNQNIPKTNPKNRRIPKYFDPIGVNKIPRKEIADKDFKIPTLSI